MYLAESCSVSDWNKYERKLRGLVKREQEKGFNDIRLLFIELMKGIED